VGRVENLEQGRLLRFMSWQLPEREQPATTPFGGVGFCLAALILNL